MGGKDQVVAGPGSGLVKAVWLVFLIGVSWKQVCYSQVVRGLGSGWMNLLEIVLFCAPVGSPGATEPTPWLPGLGIPFPQGFLLLWSPL